MANILDTLGDLGEAGLEAEVLYLGVLALKAMWNTPATALQASQRTCHEYYVMMS